MPSFDENTWTITNDASGAWYEPGAFAIKTFQVYNPSGCTWEVQGTLYDPSGAGGETPIIIDTGADLAKGFIDVGAWEWVRFNVTAGTGETKCALRSYSTATQGPPKAA